MKTAPIDAATIVLVRPCAERNISDIEVLLVLRNVKSSFLPGYHVFPGGALDPEDYQSGMERFVRGMGQAEAARILTDMSLPEKALGVWVAAIRETFEEAGTLFAKGKDGTPVFLEQKEQRKRFEKYRRGLNCKKMKFIRMLEEEEIFLSADSLHYFSHWITPEIFPLRYDVRFFVAEFPAGQSAIHDGEELVDHIWLRPAAALEAYSAGRMNMILPQIMTLEELSRFQTVSDIIASAQSRHISAHLTKISNVNGQNVEVMPDGTVFEMRPPVYP